MSCSFCGGANCIGTCLSATVSQQGLQGSCINNPNYVSGYFPAGQTFTMTTAYQNPIYLGGMPAVDLSLTTFLDTIADRTDPDACVVFIERQLTLRANQTKELERLQKQYRDDLEKNEREFLEKCKKYRPSITPEIMNRVKGLKAFY